MGIRKLPDFLINQIAAGEVIERPAYVVKELVENSIDARASEIEINISKAGKSNISVSDNGLGIEKTDLKLTVERHATSKLKDDDLYNLNFLGFRGEALPSIASVSELTIESIKYKKKEAWGIFVQKNQLKDFFPSSRNVGTKVSVRNLFYSVPARLKFLKSDKGENAHSHQIIKKLAIINHQISFRLKIDNNLVLNFSKEEKSSEGLKNRINEVLGSNFVANAIQLNNQKFFNEQSIKLSGFISLPTLNQANQTKQFIFVNGRAVQDRGLSSVVRLSYRETLPKGRHPIYCLFIQVPNDFVDVNVHPTKMEVRFKDYSLVKSLIISSVSSSLNIESRKTTAKNFEEMFCNLSEQQLNKNKQLEIKGQFENFNFKNSIKNYVESEKENQESIIDNFRTDFPLGNAIYQFNKNYIISIASTGIIIVDQHAAHERIVLERMKASLLNKKPEKQLLLLPEVIDLDFAQFEIIFENFGILEKIGFSIEEFGKNSILIREIPLTLTNFDIKQVIIDLSDDLIETGLPVDYEEKHNLIMGNIACHRSVRSGRSLSLEEMNALLREMEITPNSGQCNHGRPTSILISLKDFEKLFQRS